MGGADVIVVEGLVTVLVEATEVFSPTEVTEDGVACSPVAATEVVERLPLEDSEVTN